jgi:hypothetical protein
VDEPLAVLLLPCRLEDFELEAHARDLLNIPRVIALEPSPRRTPKVLRDVLPVRQARRLRLPGEPRVIIIYHPSQYPLARALCARYERAELWYFRGRPGVLDAERGYTRQELQEFDELASERATGSHLVSTEADPRAMNEPLRLRLHDLEIISARPFVPWGRVETR